MRAKQFITELYDPEKKYTGGITPPPPNTPRGGDGPWEPEPNDEWWKRQFREFAKTLKYDLSKAGMNILYPRNPNEHGTLFDANFINKSTKAAVRVIAEPHVYPEDRIVEARIRILLWKRGKDKDEPEEYKLRAKIDNIEHVEWVIKRITSLLTIIQLTENLEEETLIEAATDIVYHYMNTYDAVRTLRDNHYSLESSTGLDVEQKMMPANKHWYLATTRSKVGDYHIQKAGTSGAIFVLDGRWLNQNYETKPVDYWSPVWNWKSLLKKGVWSKEITPYNKRSMWQDKPYSGSEAEDRVFSDTHAIPLRGSTLEIHVFVISTVHKPFSDAVKNTLQLSTYYDKESLGARAAEVREILSWGRKRDIPVYLYDNKQDWITQRPNNRIDPNSEYGRKLLSGKPAKSYIRTHYESDYYNNAPYWIELIEKNPATDTLSEPANKLRYNILYYWDTYKSFETNVLGNAARNPESPDYPGVIEINKFLSQRRLPNIKALQEFLKRKWADYKER